MFVMNRHNDLKHRRLWADAVASIASGGRQALAMPITFFDTQVYVRAFIGDEVQEFCRELERQIPDPQLLQQFQGASSLVMVVYFERVLVYNELKESEVGRLMDGLTKHGDLCSRPF